MCSLTLNVRPYLTPRNFEVRFTFNWRPPSRTGGSQPLSAPSLEKEGISQLVLFSCSLASLLQLTNLSTSLCTRAVTVVLDAPQQAIARLSAYALTKVAYSNCPRRSLMKRSGDKTDPWGKPSWKLQLLHRDLLTFTLGSRLVSQARTHTTDRGGEGRGTASFCIFRRRLFLTPCHTPTSSRKGRPPLSPLPGIH